MAHQHPLSYRLVSALAVKDRLGLFLKPALFAGGLISFVVLLEHTVAPQDSRRTFLELLPSVGTGSLILAAIFFAVMTQVYRLQLQLQHLAERDHLTDLPNRRVFLARLEQTIESGARGTLLILDADHFKRINDTYGHGAGDDCLRAIAARLQAACLDGDHVARLGGEEFAVFLTDPTNERRDAAGAWLTAPLSVPIDQKPEPITLTLSAGAAEVTSSVPVNKQLHRADLALYAAKRAGRGRMIAWHRSLEDADNHSESNPPIAFPQRKRQA